MRLILFTKAKRAAIGARSKSGKYVKVAEGRWVPVKNRDALPKRVTDTLKAKVPPAWTELKYYSDPNSKLLVQGKDSKGRTQYLYNPKHVSVQSEEKFARIRSLNRKFKAVSAEVAADVKAKNTEAECLWLIMSTGIRPGSEKDTKGNVEAFGATTLLGKHVKRTKEGVVLKFIGKKGVSLEIPVTEPGVVKMLLRRKRAAKGEGRLFSTTGDKLLRYTKALGDGAGFQSKDFRTHLGTSIAAKAMRGKKPATMKEYKKMVRDVADKVAAQLGNTRAVALQSYINPAIFEKWRQAVE